MTRFRKRKQLFFRRCYYIKIFFGDGMIGIIIFLSGKEINRAVNFLQAFKKIDITRLNEDIEPGSCLCLYKTFSQSDTDKLLLFLFKQPFPVII